MLPDPVVIVKGKLVDQKTGLPLGSKIIFESLPDGKEAGIAHSDPTTGEYEIQLPVGKLYGIRAEATDHLSTSQNLDLRKIAYGPVKQDLKLAPDEHAIAARPGDKPVDVQPIELTPIADNATIPLNNIFFNFDDASLRSESFPELNRIVALMAERKAMQVEIGGHTDSLGPDAYNMKLSERRANTVTQYLVDKGVDASRITTTWFGETKPVDTTNTKVGNRKNRRVEFKILKLQ